MFVMKEEYKTGVPSIDEEHGKLFEIGQRAYELLKIPYDIDKYDKIVAIIEELRQYTIYHFKNEEEYMESINYKRLFSQKIDHANFIKKISEVDLEKIDEDHNEALMELLIFLKNWLVHHISEKDSLIPIK